MTQFRNHVLDGDLCKKNFISTYSIFLVFRHDFIICIDFTHIAAANTAADDVTN